MAISYVRPIWADRFRVIRPIRGSFGVGEGLFMIFNRNGKPLMKRFALAGSVAGLAVVALSACGPAAADSSAKDAAMNAGNNQASSSRCTSGDLSVMSKPAEGGGAGHATSRLWFTNESSSTCWVYGYPGVSYVAGDDGHQVGGSATRDTQHAAQKIWLSSHELAYADLDQVNPYNYPDTTCNPTHVRGLRLYPPDETAAKYVKAPGTACANTTTGRPTISVIMQ